MTVAIFVFAVYLLLKRVFGAKTPVYIFKSRFREDRIMELLFLGAILFFTVVDYINGGNYKIDLILFILLAGMTIAEYNKNKIGIYETGVLFKSQFYPWRDIYTFRSYDLTSGRIKITFFLHRYFQRDELNKWSVVLDREIGEKAERILDTKLDRSLN